MKTHVDWLKFRTQSSPFEVLETLKPSFIGELLELGDQQRGKDGWESRRPLLLADVTVGAIDYGGDSQRGWARVEFPGEGCKWVADWGRFHDGAMSLQRAEVKRVDLALDTFDGSVGHDRCCAALDSGGFSNGGRPPKAKEILPRAGVQGGRTLYVGRREGAKFYRCYEKGWQTIERLPETARRLLREDAEGCGLRVHGVEVPPADWYRCEIEFKATDGYCPPWLSVREPDSYFAGACPFFGDLVPFAQPRPVQRMPDFGARLELEAALEHLRVAYGGVIRAALMAGLSEAQVMETITANKPSERLVKAGVLMIDAGA